MAQPIRSREVLVYASQDGKEPFWEWLDDIGDIRTRTSIEHRVNRVKHGLLGDCEAVGDGVSELKIHLGPGYRIYFAELDKKTILLLNGGTKRAQAKDIQQAKRLWRSWKQEQ